MSEFKRLNTDSGEFEYSDGEYWFDTMDVCHHCIEQCEENGTPFQFAEERTSLGIYAGRYCDNCWDSAGYRKEGAEGYSFLDAGEYYYEDEY